MTKFNPNDPSIWKDFDPFKEDDLNWDGDQNRPSVRKRPISLYRNIYKKFYVEHISKEDIRDIYKDVTSKDLKAEIHSITRTNFPEYKAVYDLCRYDRQYHEETVLAYLDWRKQEDYENKPVYLFRSPGNDLLDFYDQMIEKSKYGRAQSKDGLKYAPSHIYHLRFEKKYDIYYIKNFVKKHYNKDIDSAEANRVWRLYPWLTNKAHYYYTTDYAGGRGKGRLLAVDALDQVEVDNVFYLDLIRGQTSYNGPKLLQAGAYTGWSIIREVGTKWLDNSISIEEIKILLQDESDESMDEKRKRGSFLKKYKNVTFQIWTETFVVITDPNGNEHIFKKKKDALMFIANDLQRVGLVVKADRITRILKDGYVMMARPAGKGSGKGGKQHYDAMPGWKFKVDYRPNGYAINNKSCGSRTSLIIDNAVEKGWISKPTEIVKKQK